MSKKLLGSALAGLTAAAGVISLSPARASAASLPLSDVQIAEHFDLAAGQTSENTAMAPDGSAYVTFAEGRQVAEIAPTGAIRILATLPPPADGGVHTPVLGFPLTVGVTRADDGTLYFRYATGTADLNSVWRLPRGGGRPQRIAALPPTACPPTARRRPAPRPGPGPAHRHSLHDRLRPGHRLERPDHRRHPHRLVHRPPTGIHRLPRRQRP